ncbi:hypothetical protein CHTY_001530, partial [Candidatus Phytoplasma meliae]|nr:hypothetical protein [Candidatus Phytoplasma meliae]
MHNFPNKLKSNDKLLIKIINLISQEFISNFDDFDNQKKDDLLYNLELMESHNIIDEFKGSIQQTVFNAHEYIFAFPGNPTDFKNYKHYLQAKANNFSSPKEFSWSMWSPSNFSFVSKTYVQFLIDNFAILQEKEQEINNSKININANNQHQSLQQEYKKLEKQILEQAHKLQKQADVIKTQSEEILNQESQI